MTQLETQLLESLQQLSTQHEKQVQQLSTALTQQAEQFGKQLAGLASQQQQTDLQVKQLSELVIKLTSQFQE